MSVYVIERTKRNEEISKLLAYKKSKQNIGQIHKKII